MTLHVQNSFLSHPIRHLTSFSSTCPKIGINYTMSTDSVETGNYLSQRGYLRST